MAGRLGMTGDSVGRGDRDVYKALGEKGLIIGLAERNVKTRFTSPRSVRMGMRQDAFRISQRSKAGGYQDAMTPQQVPRSYFGKSRRKVAGALVATAGVAGLAGSAAGFKRGVRYGERGGILQASDQDKHAQAYVRSVKKALTDMSEADAKKLSGQYPAGRLPKHLDRPSRMKAYEARYVAAGGPKGEAWQSRAKGAQGVRNVGIGAGTAATAGLLATRGRSPLARRALKNVALVSATTAGAGELGAELSRHKRGSYASSPAGVAASALTRMRNNTPKEL